MKSNRIYIDKAVVRRNGVKILVTKLVGAFVAVLAIILFPVPQSAVGQRQFPETVPGLDFGNFLISTFNSCKGGQVSNGSICDDL